MSTDSRSLWHDSLAEFQQAVEKRPTPGCGAAAAVGACLGLSLVLKGLRLTASKRQDDAETADLIARGDALYRELAVAVDEDAVAFSEWLAAKRLDDDDEEKPTRLDAARTASIEVPLAAAACCERALSLAVSSLDETAAMLESDTAAGALMVKAGMEALLVGVKANLEGLSAEARGDVERRCETLQSHARRHCQTLGVAA
ncbi:cyclodeaminase/cyclohydrolase family protein [Salinicola aestuarinus]|uniref:cyclodeaminase/cyclohydrolase family protein n=1 Tax=Salinicola aestuarinus TaxID=1949082 RepID=UPI000DA1684C|nr:cyclodeaminase/cyclohydrolase family protein [Salinicola aestuarinus]